MIDTIHERTVLGCHQRNGESDELETLAKKLRREERLIDKSLLLDCMPTPHLANVSILRLKLRLSIRQRHHECKRRSTFIRTFIGSPHEEVLEPCNDDCKPCNDASLEQVVRRNHCLSSSILTPPLRSIICDRYRRLSTSPEMDIDDINRKEDELLKSDSKPTVFFNNIEKGQ